MSADRFRLLVALVLLAFFGLAAWHVTHPRLYAFSPDGRVLNRVSGRVCILQQEGSPPYCYNQH